MPEPLSPDELSAIDSPEKLENKYTVKKISETNIKLCMISNVMKENRILPELKAGLEELEKKDRKQYDAVVKKVNAWDNSILKSILMSYGYDYEKHEDVHEKGREGIKMVIPYNIKIYRDNLKK